jgi:hypothetical protein
LGSLLFSVGSRVSRWGSVLCDDSAMTGMETPCGRRRRSSIEQNSSFHGGDRDLRLVGKPEEVAERSLDRHPAEPRDSELQSQGHGQLPGPVLAFLA